MTQLFRGYVPTRDKKCKEKFKDREDLKTYDQVKDLPEFAGILGQETILIDVDDFDTSELLFKIVQDLQLKCRVMKTTRGKHFYFKNGIVPKNKTGCRLAVGLTADIKVGCSNSYAVLKFSGIERPILYDTPEDEIQEVPMWLTPIATRMEFLDMGEGDGRNQALFNYILTLQSEDFTVEESRDTITVINRFILKNPLGDREMDVILRDDAFKKPIFFKETRFLHDKFATYLKNNYHIIRNDGTLLIYKKGVYEYSMRSIGQAMVEEISNLRDAQRSEVLKHLNLICEDVEARSTSFIAFRNGVLNIETNELLPFSHEYIITNKIDWDYNPEAYSELADKTLNKLSCNDAEIRLILEEIIGACFYRSNTVAGGKSIILVGEGANGKSTYIAVLSRVLGKENVSALDMKNLSDRFSTIRIYKKLANLGDDISEEFNADTSYFKKISTGEMIEAEEKGQPKFEFTPYCKMIFSANTVPRIRDKTGAAQRRMLIVPFNAKFSNTDEEYNPEIKHLLMEQTSIEYFIALGVAGLQRLLRNKKFTDSKKVQTELENYAERNDPVLSFIKECADDETRIENEPVDKIFRKYLEFCNHNGLNHPLAKPEFSKQIQRILKLTTKRPYINKIKTTIFLPDG